MAWPLTPTTSYVANSTPVIKASDLNLWQTTFNAIFLATYSLKAVVVDGTGGSVVVPVAGTLKVSGSASSAAIPGTAVAAGLMYREQVLHGFVRAYWNGAAIVIVRQINVQSVTRAGPGSYDVLFASTLTSPADAVPIATPFNHPTVVARGAIISLAPVTASAGRAQVAFWITDTDANFIDPPDGFCLALYGY